MARLPLCSSQQIINALRRAGFEPASSGRGSHLTLERRVGRRTITTVVVMGKREVLRPTPKNILKLAEMTQREFLQHLR